MTAELERARRLFDLGRDVDAELLLRTHLCQDPESATGHRMLSSALTRQGRYREALAPAQRAVRLVPEDAGNYIALADALSGRDRGAEAVRAAREAVRLEPHAWAAHYALSRALLCGPTRRLADALAAANEVVRLTPTDPDGHNLAGVCLVRLRKHDEARRAFEACLTIDPDHTSAIANLALVNARASRLGPASRLVSTALAGEPQSAQLRRTYERIRFMIIRRVWFALCACYLVVSRPGSDATDLFWKGVLVVATILACVSLTRRVSRQLPRGRLLLGREDVGRTVRGWLGLIAAATVGMVMFGLTLPAQNPATVSTDPWVALLRGGGAALGLLAVLGAVANSVSAWRRRRRPGVVDRRPVIGRRFRPVLALLAGAVVSMFSIGVTYPGAGASQTPDPITPLHLALRALGILGLCACAVGGVALHTVRRRHRAA